MISGPGDASDERLAGIDALVCDLDGVVYRGHEPVPGSADAIEELRRRRIKLLFCTNNSRFTVREYARFLEQMGVSVSDDEVLTSAIVTAGALAARRPAGAEALVVGGDGIRDALRGAGISIAPEDATTSDIVVVGWDPEFTYTTMRRAADAVRSGAVFVATNDDATYPAADGLWPGAGSILASIETASGRRAEVMGKPHEPMLDAIAERLSGCARIAVVGDRPETDLAGAAARGWLSVLVLSGVTSAGDSGAVSPAPDIVARSLGELVGQL